MSSCSRRTPQSAQRSQRLIFSAVFALSAVFTFGGTANSQDLPTSIPQTKFSSGQNVVPYFEGWIRNADGSFDLVFGYFNRNWEQDLAIPIGPDNFFEPGAQDRGQPTFFLPRRQGWVHRVRVPADFGKQVLTWTIRSNGKTEKAYGELLPVEEITERIIMTRGGLNPGDGDPNKPPIVAIDGPAARTDGARTDGARTDGARSLQASVTQPLTLVAKVTDDGLPKPREPIKRTQTTTIDPTRQSNTPATAARRGLSVTWMQLRGPAKAVFDKSGSTPVAEGKASVGVKFSQPGTYVLRATANDGGLSTKTDVTISVREGT